ncbi:class I adenylate cyclase [Maridesulfovibrio sp. FT414]|uniref:class I adenylate cyclase n=1 Tax=Maridesulfovibrio sp. FT414 TaxID=2979469 RepID=UPI003D800F24
MTEQVIQDTLLRELRRLNLYPPEVRQLGELRSKIEERVKNARSPGDDLDLSKYTVMLYGMALKSLEADASEGRKSSYAQEDDDYAPFICLDALSVLGICSRTMAAELLCNKLLPFSRLKQWFEEKPDAVAVSVADRIVALNPANALERVNYARSVIAKASSFERNRAVAFFKGNGTRKGQLTFSTLENFMSGNFGTECRRSLSEPQTLEEISECTESMPSYPEIALVQDVAFHLRTMDPVIMKKVLRAVERLADEVDDETMKQVIPLAMSPSLFLAKAAMDVIAKFGGRRRGRIFARVFNGSTQTRAELVNRLPLLSGDNFVQFMNSIPKEFHSPVISTVFSTLSEEDPQCFGTILSSVLKKSRSKSKKLFEPMLKDIFERDSLTEPGRPDMGEGRSMQGIDFIKLGAPIVLNVMKKKSNSGFTRIFGQEDDVSDGAQDIYTDGQIANQHIHKLNRWKSRGKGIVFRNCSFSACDFRASFMEGCVYRNCKFESCSFAESTYSESRFRDCSFSSCSFQQALLYDCTFKSCSFRCSHFDSAVFFMASFDGCRFDLTAFPGAFFCRAGFKSCGFRVADLREAYVYKGRLLGVSFANCDFSGAFFSAGEARTLEFCDCSTFGLKALSMKTGDSELLKAMNRTLAGRLGLRERLKKRSRSLGKLDQYQRAIQHSAVKLWFAFKDIQRSHARFAENNSRRLAWAGSRMNEKGRTFFQILPALLHTTVFERSTGITDLSVPSSMKGYHLSAEVLRCMGEIFPDVKIEDEVEAAVPIEALMSIGSTGTIAQGASSDLDCWVCCDFSGSRGDSRERLQFKLRAIEEWADSEFALEVHFFIMDVREVRDNMFGLSDEESSGSAQSALLKEEFYRTALLISGKPPLWWFSPPEADEKAYQDTLKRVSLLCGKDYFTDLGNVPHIPLEEFFGASLWQIVKGVKSPFKSIMKFGLLELYTSGRKTSLLCESIKRNILDGMRRLRRVDPYMLLYRDLADFYTEQGNPEYTWLTAMALRLKCGLLEEKRLDSVPERPEEREIIEFATGLAGTNSPGCLKGFKGLSDFRSVVALGDKINQFMLKTYMKVRGEQDGVAGSAITPEDLTRLGRVIFSNFAKRKHKVERVSLPGSRTHFFDSLIVTRDKGGVWDIQGEYAVEAGSRVEQTTVESGKDLTSMLVWVALNGIYNRDMKIRSDMSSAPVRDREVAGLLESLMQFFPRGKVFKTPVEEALNQEQIQRAFFIVNFCSPREDKKVREVYLVYSTNWGEVFCKPIDVTPALVETPEAYLKTEMADICSSPVKMGQFVPQSSVCPYLKIPVD